MPETYQSMLATAVCQFHAIGLDSAVLDARLIVQHVLGISHEMLVMKPNTVITGQQKQAVNALIDRRLAHEPMAYILGKKEFWGLDFKVTRDTLIPRPDSETLVSAVLAHFSKRTPPKTLLDIGTGTGCLLLALLTEWPETHGIGVDISARALSVAHTNALALGLNERSKWQISSWAHDVAGRFDVIISNPPYIAPSDARTLSRDIMQYEPHTALFAEENGLAAYRAILNETSHLLSDSGLLAFEIGAKQQTALTALLSEAGFDAIQCFNDYGGNPRILLATHSSH